MAKKSFLDSIRSPRPCSKDWNEMIGDERVRFCQGCEKNVYNLSAMSRKDAQKLVALNSGKVCVRYIRLPDGRVQTAHTKLHKITRRTSQLATGVFGAALMVSAIADAQTQIPPKTESSKAVKSQNKSSKQTSQISFTVFFSTSGDIITNAEVKLINQSTKEEFTTLSNQQGLAQFSLIPHGTYSVKTNATGFFSDELNIQIKELSEPNIQIFLDISHVTGVIEVVDYELPLFYAIAQKDNESVKEIINSGFDIKTKNKGGQTALHVAHRYLHMFSSVSHSKTHSLAQTRNTVNK